MPLTAPEAKRVFDLVQTERRAVSVYDTALRVQQSGNVPNPHPSVAWKAYQDAQNKLDAYLNTLRAAKTAKKGS
jgi:hypothetical protein